MFKSTMTPDQAYAAATSRGCCLQGKYLFDCSVELPTTAPDNARPITGRGLPTGGAERVYTDVRGFITARMSANGRVWQMKYLGKSGDTVLATKPLHMTEVGGRFLAG